MSLRKFHQMAVFMGIQCIAAGAFTYYYIQRNVPLQSVKAAFHHRSKGPTSSTTPTTCQDLPMVEKTSQAEVDDEPHQCDNSALAEGEVDENELSESEGLEPDTPNYSGLFTSTIFKSFFFKAKAITALMRAGDSSTPDKELKNRGSGCFLSRRFPVIPFLPLRYSLMLFNVSGLNLAWLLPLVEWTSISMLLLWENLLQWPKVDAHVPGDEAEGLKVEDKKEESSFCKAHLASTWAIRATTAISYFNCPFLMWLCQILDRLPPGDTRCCQPLSSLPMLPERSKVCLVSVGGQFNIPLASLVKVTP
ncbi:PREDICTED: uncharacterized protein LOC106544605 isoform X1 [Thamnophis sirtalis]|uniref:Uncharacterized protein LOC106544605 isoform X1 n=1 Tax=Thamnophis sirtalis TaxID=35019 RepID=A0A6I9Y0E6_9SAUR|nr:PREDICTED: uncharacterized protein LOC106544605 isoform X1 [Thamnophis sirtalis]